MTDISVFKKMLDQKPYSTAKGYVYLAARLEIRTGRFAYSVGFKSWPISKLFTFSLADARAAAASFGVPVIEVGPPEAFVRKFQPAKFQGGGIPPGQ
jgi:hypothetical protein